jgi:hypothetical protein
MSNTLIEKVRSIGGLVIEIWSEDLKHAIDGHPEVTIEKVKDTLKDPEKVIQSRNSGNACLFYSIQIGIRGAEDLFFCVVVAITSSGIGKMVTAYDADFIKTGKVLYSQSRSK